MVNYTKILNMLLPACLIFLVGCNHIDKEKEQKDYNFGVLYSNGLFDESKIQLFNDKGNILDKEKTKYKGITYSAFTNKGQVVGENIYFANPNTGNKENNFILQFNKNTFMSKEISSSVISPTVFHVDNTHAYLASSGVDNFSLSKVNLETGKEEFFSNSSKGHIIQMTSSMDEIYALVIKYTDNDETYGYLNILKKDDLSQVSSIKLGDISYSEDISYKDDYVYIVQSLKSKNDKGNDLIRIDVNTEEVKNIELPFNTLNQIHFDEKFIYVTQGSARREYTEKKIAKISLNTFDVDVLNTDIENFVSFAKNGKLYISNGELMQVYALDKFDKIAEFSISSDSQFTTFFIK